jgi:hypothetical protein
MSIHIDRGIPGDEQQESFQNATLQSGPPGYEFSIAVNFDVPMIGVYDQDTLENWLRKTLEPITDDPRVHVTIQMGPEGDGQAWYIEGLEACEPGELTRGNEEGVKVVVEPELTANGFNSVTLIADEPRSIVKFVRRHWGSDDPAWLQEVEDRIEWGDVPYASL